MVHCEAALARQQEAGHLEVCTLRTLLQRSQRVTHLRALELAWVLLAQACGWVVRTRHATGAPLEQAQLPREPWHQKKPHVTPMRQIVSEANQDHGWSPPPPSHARKLVCAHGCAAAKPQHEGCHTGTLMCRACLGKRRGSNKVAKQSSATARTLPHGHAHVQSLPWQAGRTLPSCGVAAMKSRSSFSGRAVSCASCPDAGTWPTSGHRCGEAVTHWSLQHGQR